MTMAKLRALEAEQLIAIIMWRSKLPEKIRNPEFPKSEERLKISQSLFSFCAPARILFNKKMVVILRLILNSKWENKQTIFVKRSRDIEVVYIKIGNK